MPHSVLFACARPTPPFFYGGVEVSCRLVGAELRAAGFRVSHVGSYTSPQRGHDLRLQEFERALPPEARGDWGGRPALRYESPAGLSTMVHRDVFGAAVERAVEEDPPALVVAVGEGAEVAVRAGRAAGATSVAWAMDVSQIGPVAAGAGADATVYSSRFVRERLRERGGPPGAVLYPPFADPAPAAARRRREAARRRVLMVNPVAEKGVDVFLALARRRPDVEFVAVEGWWNPDWSNGGPPANVSYRRRTDRLEPEYLAADVTIVPSRVLEGFGMVAVESGLCGTPALCAAVGGLPEACPEDTLVSGWDAGAWDEALERTLEPAGWAARSAAAREHAQRFLGPRAPQLLAAAGL